MWELTDNFLFKITCKNSIKETKTYKENTKGRCYDVEQLTDANVNEEFQEEIGIIIDWKK